MILIIISLILTITTCLCLGISFETKKDGYYSNTNVIFKKRPRMLFGLCWLIIILFGCFSTIKTGEIGIKTRFGKIVEYTKNEGIVFKSPIDHISKINIKVQKYENDKALETSTKDMQVVGNIKVSINYQINGTKAVDLYKKVGTNYKSTILEPAIQETIKAVISKYTSEELVTKRSEISLDINKTLNDRISKYGINSIGVSINNFDFSKAYNEAIEKKAVAEQEVQTSKNQLEKAKVDAETKKVKAQGDAEANKVLEKSLTDLIIKQQFIEKWDGKLPSVSGGNSIIDISSILK